eukprot:TRINITY_DN26483_c0_g1_i1.p1 TRINITY_DN26483_c0_g1~~TRINITY_DN26483_c0_g1_i1.p1  ORF type:complete len:683 (-),score=154.24 TRINITY_DN26483_c0_g1_i1:122-2170(-)
MDCTLDDGQPKANLQNGLPKADLPLALQQCLQEISSQCQSLASKSLRLQLENARLQEALADAIGESAVVRQQERWHENDCSEVCTPMLEALPGSVPDLVLSLDAKDRPSVHPPTLELPASPPADAPAEIMKDATESTALTKAASLASKQSVSQDSSAVCSHGQSENGPGRRMSSTNSMMNASLQSLGANRLHMLSVPDPVNPDEEPLNSIHEVIDAFAPKGQGESYIEKLHNALSFKVLCIIFIVMNSFHIYVQTDQNAKNSYKRVLGLPQEPQGKVWDGLFLGWFLLELLVKLAATGKRFVYSKDWLWNLFDFFLVVQAMLDMVLASFVNLSYLRILRVFRLVRVVRVVKNVKALQSLRTMIFALFCSMTALMWSLVMIMLVTFVFGIIFCSSVATFFEEIDLNNSEQVEAAKQVHASFGTMRISLVSLYSAITGGNDWMMYGSALELVGRYTGGHDILFFLFLFYIGFCSIGLLNVVTGIFVDSAVTTRTEDEVVENYNEDYRRTCQEVMKVFTEADQDHSGYMNYQEFEQRMADPWVKAYFSGLDIDTSDVRTVFTLMDVDGDHKISNQEFIDGTMKLKGYAKSIDIYSLLYDNARLSTRLTKLCSLVEDQTRDIKEMIQPGSSEKDVRLFPDVSNIVGTLQEAQRASAVVRASTIQTSARAEAQNTLETIRQTLSEKW